MKVMNRRTCALKGGDKISISEGQLEGKRIRGAALIIVLAFVILTSGLIILFLTRTTLEQQTAAVSTAQVQIETFSRGALANIVNDLKAEILAGSTVSTVTTGTVCTPLFQQAAVPSVTAPNAGTGGLQNLLKESAYQVPFFSGTGYSTSTYTPNPHPAAGVSTGTATSTTGSIGGTSLNGRYITAARWNQHLLMPPNSPTDYTPNTTQAFVLPDWVLVARDGSNPTAWNSNMVSSPSNLTNQKTVVGRYAYAIYNEGGLLDMNVAGAPSPLVPSSTGTTVLQNDTYSYKNALALADLTQIGLTQAQIDALVAWRNNASAYDSGGAGSPGESINGGTSTSTWTSGQAGSYYTNWVLGNVTGFLRTNPNLPNTTATQTDQAFVNRQQLIQFFMQGLGGGSPSGAQTLLANSLQYMGTFSRALEQPSFAPNPNRPLIVSNAPSLPKIYAKGDAASTYGGGNNAYGQDTVVNPSFLTVRVKSAFTRLNGTPAVVGEPLVKTKFPLSELNLLNLPVGGTGTSTVGTAAQMQNYFGLAQNPNDPSREGWMYVAGVAPTGTWSTGTLSIATLAQVAALNREPNFIELLKAAINAGSLGKAAPSGETGFDYPHGEYTCSLDTNIDYQVLQIAANIIDQWDTDSIPTRIYFADGSTTTGGRTFRGVENLPYFDRMTGSTFPLIAPSPSVGNFSGNFANIATTTTTGSSTTTTTLKYVPAHAGTVTNPGLAALMITPIIWNPHDTTGGVVGAGASLTTDRPTQFRLTAVTSDPNGNNPWNVAAQAETYNQTGTTTTVTTTGTTTSATTMTVVLASPASSAYTALTETNTELDFGDANGTLFNEPTLLWRPGIPTRSNLQLGPSNRLRSDPVLVLSGTNAAAGSATYAGITDLNTSQTIPQYFIGILCGTSAIEAGKTDSITGNQYVVKTNRLAIAQTGAPGSIPSITFRLEYQDPTTSKWVIYDEKYVSFGLGITLSQYVSGDPLWEQQPMYNGAFDTGSIGTGSFVDAGSPGPSVTGQGPAGCIDPRSSRFPIGWRGSNISAALDWDANHQFFSTIPTQWPSAAIGSTATGTAQPSYDDNYLPGGDASWIISAAGIAQMGLFSDPSYSANYPYTNPHTGFYPGLYSQNNPLVQSVCTDGHTREAVYYTDADGIARRAMAAYVPNGASGPASQTLGLPMTTANTYSANASGVVTATTAQVQSRPIVLNRPFNSPAEMSYASRGEPWKNIDFFTPESGDTALLDVFCINPPPANGMVAGKVDLNTRQPLVLQAILSGAYRDAQENIATPTSDALPALSTTEAGKIATALVTRTTNTTQSWEGPLANIGELVGRYVGTGVNPTTSPLNDSYTFTNPTTSTGTYTYSGLIAGLNNVWDNTGSAYIQRLREAAIRPLVNCGQVRVWNLMIDLVAQTGSYPATSTGLNQFLVQGEKHYWIHLAIDRATGQVIDQQIEEVTE